MSKTSATAVDARYKLIVHHEVTNAQTDEGRLVGMSATAREVLEVEGLEVVADKGYYACEEIKRCEAQGIVTAQDSPREDETVQSTRRAPIRDDEARDESGALPAAGGEEDGGGDEPDGAQLQPEGGR